MNGLYHDPGLRKAIAQQDFEHRFAESEKVRLMKIAFGEKNASGDNDGYDFRHSLKAFGGLVADTTSLILTALGLKNRYASS